MLILKPIIDNKTNKPPTFKLVKIEDFKGANYDYKDTVKYRIAGKINNKIAIEPIKVEDRKIHKSVLVTKKGLSEKFRIISLT